MDEDHQHDQQPCKKPRMDNEISECATAMKVAGFSLSAIEEMKTRHVDGQTEDSLGQQLREFQVLDEVGSGSEESGNLLIFLLNFLIGFSFTISCDWVF